MRGIEDPWRSGEPYARFMGRWSRPMAANFLQWLAAPTGQAWLDLGCGTGSLSQMILEIASPSRVVAVDPTPGFLEHARRSISDPRIRFELAAADALTVEAESMDALVSGLVLNFLPDLRLAMEEMKRVVRPAGVVAAYVWDYAGKMEMLRYFWDVAIELDPRAVELDEGERFPLCHPEALEQVFSETGLKEVEVQALDMLAVFADFEDYWSPFLGGQGPAPGYVTRLNRKERENLEIRLRERLPVRRDGSIELLMRAWAVKGVR